MGPGFERILVKLEALEKRFEEIESMMSDPATVSRPSAWTSLAKERAQLEPVVLEFRNLKSILKETAETRAMLDEGGLDEELRMLAEEELEALGERRRQSEARLKEFLIPRDPRDDKNVIMEIRAGTGGEEASLFAADLYRMYSRYADRKGWRTEVMSSSPSELGGLKEMIFVVEGRGAYGRLKHESGVHRVQRVPVTESSGRIHTSTATVAVLPEAEEVDVQIDPGDLRIDTYCSSGPGGQGVNTAYSAVRITHIPTGLVVTCQDERSQLQNKERAMRILRARLLEMARAERDKKIAEERRSQVGMAERSEKVRTYNFHQDRVTDHRIGLTLYRLDEVMDGDLDELIDALMAADRAEKMAQLGGDGGADDHKAGAGARGQAS